MENPYRIRRLDNGLWEVCHAKFPSIFYPKSIGSKDHAFNFMAEKLGVTPDELRFAARMGTLA